MKIPEGERRRIAEWAERTSRRMQDRLRGRDPAEKARNLAFGRMAEIVAARTLESLGWSVDDVSGESEHADCGTDLVAKKGRAEARVQVKSTPGRMLILPEQDYGTDVRYRWTKGAEPPSAFMLVKTPSDEAGDFEVLGGISADEMKSRGTLMPKDSPVCPGALADFRIRMCESAIGEELGFSPPARFSEYPNAPRLSRAAWVCDMSDLSYDPDEYLVNSPLRSGQDSI